MANERQEEAQEQTQQPTGSGDRAQSSAKQKKARKRATSERRDKREFARIIREGRINRGWSQEDLAEKLGYGVRTVQRWENPDEGFPQPEIYAKLCELFNIDPVTLLHVPSNNQQSSENVLPINISVTPHIELTPLAAEESTQGAEDRISTNTPVPQRLGTKRDWLFIAISILLIAVMATYYIRFPRNMQTPSGKTNARILVNQMLGSTIFSHSIPKTGSYETQINAVAWSQDNTYLACAIGNHTVIIFNIKTEEETMVYPGHSDNVNSLVWLPDGEEIASASTDRTVQIWNAFTGSTVATFRADSSVWAVAVSPDGKKIAWSEKNGQTQVWSIMPQKRLFIYNGQAGSNGIWGLEFSHKGKQIAAGDNKGDIQIFDATSGKLELDYHKHTGVIYGLDWSPNDHYIASASDDGRVLIWNASTRETIHVYTHNKVAMQAVSWSPDGVHVASASADGTVQVWDAFNNAAPFVYPHHSGTVYTVAWSPDGNMIASGDKDGNIQVWQAK